MFNLENFNELKNQSNDAAPFVSMYISTDRTGNAEKFQIKYKNALKSASNQLTDENLMGDKTMNKNEVDKFLSEAYDLLENNKFWSNLSDGLAVFVSKDFFDFHVVPVAFTDFTYVGQSFYLRHLMPLLTEDNRFFVLALSQNEVRFFEGGKHSITPVKIDDLVPTSMGELIGADDNEKVLQHHNGGSTTVFHGQGGAKDAQDIELEKYFKDIDDGLMKMLHDERVPMVIYSTDDQAARYKDISNYSNVFEHTISGNPENDDPVLIHEKAWNELRSFFAEKRKDKQDQFEQALANENASFSIHQVVPAAINGRIDTLYVDNDTEAVWGSFAKDTNSITIHQTRQDDSICLLEKAAISTYENGGEVFNIQRMEFPRIVAQVNAIYRY